jgi:magnesium-transporting ATPase (P-type)
LTKGCVFSTDKAKYTAFHYKPMKKSLYLNIISFPLLGFVYVYYLAHPFVDWEAKLFLKETAFHILFLSYLLGTALYFFEKYALSLMKWELGFAKRFLSSWVSFSIIGSAIIYVYFRWLFIPYQLQTTWYDWLLKNQESLYKGIFVWCIISFVYQIYHFVKGSYQKTLSGKAFVRKRFN